MLHLQQALSARFHFVKWRFVRLFNKDMKDNDSSLLDCTEKGASDSFPANCPNLEQPLSQGTGHGHSQIGSMNLHPFGDPGIESANAEWPAINGRPNFLTLIFDHPCYGR